MGHKLTEKQRLQQEELKAAGKNVDVNAPQGQTSGDAGKNAAPEPANTVPADATTTPPTTTSAGSTSRTR